jgi:hypothetical protein
MRDKAFRVSQIIFCGVSNLISVSCCTLGHSMPTRYVRQMRQNIDLLLEIFQFPIHLGIPFRNLTGAFTGMQRNYNILP